MAFPSNSALLLCLIFSATSTQLNSTLLYSPVPSDDAPFQTYPLLWSLLSSGHYSEYILLVRLHSGLWIYAEQYNMLDTGNAKISHEREMTVLNSRNIIQKNYHCNLLLVYMC